MLKLIMKSLKERLFIYLGSYLKFMFIVLILRWINCSLYQLMTLETSLEFSYDYK